MSVSELVSARPPEESKSIHGDMWWVVARRETMSATLQYLGVRVHRCELSVLRQLLN